MYKSYTPIKPNGKHMRDVKQMNGMSLKTLQNCSVFW